MKKHAVPGALVGAVAGFSLAGAVLAANLEPDSWLPTVDPMAAASVTVVEDPEADVEAIRDRDSDIGAAPRIVLRLTRSQPSPLPGAALAPWVTPRIPQIPSELGIPGIVLDAYRQAAARLGESDPSCHLDWQVLAGIGMVESGHARDGMVGADGTTFEPILGPVLDGDGYASIPDTDDGVLDGDPVWDRAVGPMQFIPGTWSFVGADGNDDAIVSPHNVFDAALGAGRYLCAGARDLAERPDLERALRSYNNSAAYVALVLAWIDGYRDGLVTPLPPQPTPPPTTTTPPTGPPTTEPPTTGPPTTGPPTTTPPTTPPTTTPKPSTTGPLEPTPPPSTTPGPSDTPTSPDPSSATPSSTGTASPSAES